MTFDPNSLVLITTSLTLLTLNLLGPRGGDIGHDLQGVCGLGLEFKIIVCLLLLLLRLQDRDLLLSSLKLGLQCISETPHMCLLGETQP